jgi:hypothetical protein
LETARIVATGAMYLKPRLPAQMSSRALRQVKLGINF